MYTAKFEYEASADTDINLHAGDIIARVEDVGNGWSLGYNKTTGKTGTFPTEFIMKKDFRESVRRISRAKKSDDQISKENRTSVQLIPKTQARVPDPVLQRRQTYVPDLKNSIKLPTRVSKHISSFDNNIIQSNQYEHRIVKGVFGILGGAVSCGIIFVLLHYSYNYTIKMAGFITAAVALPICTALAVSTHMRCIMMLMVPSLFTGKGRAMFMSVIFALLLSGPVVNITYNAQEASQSMACTQELIYNQTEILKNKLEEPIRKIEKQIYDGLVKVRKIADDIKDAIAPVTNVINKFADELQAAKDKLKNVAQKCDSSLRTAQSKCVEGINHAKYECERKLRDVDPTRKVVKFGKDVEKTGKNVIDNVERTGKDVINKVGSFLRGWGKKRRRRRSLTKEEINALYLAYKMTENPLERYGIYLKSPAKISNQTYYGSSHALRRNKRFSLLDRICVVLDIGNVCTVVQAGHTGCQAMSFFGSVAESASDGVKSILNSIISFLHFDFDGYFDHSGYFNSSKTAAQIIAEVKGDIKEKTSLILSVSTIVSNILVLSLLFLFIQSAFYLKKFLSKDNFDNFYISTSFKLYDQQCKDNGNTSVLPLKRKERKKYVDTRSCFLSSKEIAQSKNGFTKVAIHLLIATVIIFFDYVLYYVLQLIDRYGSLNINIDGRTYLDVFVDGDGILAQFLTSFLSAISLESDFVVDFNLTTCIPNPSLPDRNDMYIFSSLYFVAFLLVIMQAYGTRLRRKIVIFFFPERDISRINFLHEKISHRRKTWRNWLSQYIYSRNKQFQIENRMSFRGWMANHCPLLAKYCCPCLPTYTTCICCSFIRDRKTKFHKCQGCSSDYCDECFDDMQHSCIMCDKKTLQHKT